MALVAEYWKEYKPERWNDVVVQNSNGFSNCTVSFFTNCYSYILNNQIDPLGYSFGCNQSDYQYINQNPGRFYNIYRSPGEAEIIDTFNAENANLIYESVLKDFQKINEKNNCNLIFLELEDIYSLCPEGTYKVALFWNHSNGDYHWYRQNADGTWSHKLGQGNVKNVDESENPQVIYDPVAAAASAGYTQTIGFYAVSPWNFFYGNEVENSDELEIQ